ncbi:MAG: hypothetical protein ABI789_03325 [Usitatibacter sp.]
MTSRAIAGSLGAALAFAGAAFAAPPADSTRLATQYSDWAGGRSNADALVAGLRNGSPITLVTSGPGRNVSIAGFTPTSSMSYGGVEAALSNAQRSLSRAGIDKPSAEQIQAGLIGGEITALNGKTTLVKGSVAPRGTNPVASR